MHHRDRVAFTLLSTVASSTLVAAQCTTEAFQSILANTPEATINFVEAVPQNGSFGQGETDIPFPTNATQLPALCAVGINVQSSSNSSYNFGLFLPDTTWNERLTTGNGGYGGGINWPDMGIFSQYGFATMSTDTGHSSAAFDGFWGYEAPETLIDWGSRAMHGSVVLSKQIINTYYTISDGIQYSYYASCSTGGRQGLKEIQMYPDSFDGISVGAPAWWSTHLSSGTLWQGLYNQPEDGANHIDPSLFPAIAAEMVKQCDPQDGVTDGIISDAFGCNFDYEALLCTPSSDAASCLTAAQIETVRKFYNDWVDEDQTFVFPSVSLGVDASFLMSSVSPLGYGYYQYWVYNDTEWDYTQFSYQDVKNADAVDPGNATADNFDLSPFMDRGGKIIKYHGMADSLIPTKSSLHFYNQVRQTLVPQGVNLDDFYRFFLVPGMDHCSGSTVAPWYIAGGSQGPVDGVTHSVPGYEDADHDIILAMMKWVEEDSAPEQLIATKFVNDSATLGVQSQRPLCVYPKQAKYVSGDMDDPASWECQSLY
ncbi:tannase and feruloyl esterase [Xylariomycetidae sp. FL2044]|nr:tannase and feruloyl esterase [Xylariomycetidae sp. FL2044]